MRPLRAIDVDVSALGTTLGADEVPYKGDCPAIAMVVGDFSDGVEWSWGPIDDGVAFPLTEEFVTHVNPGDRLYLRDAGGTATGTAQFVFLPDDATTAQGVVAMGTSLNLSAMLDRLDDLVVALEDIQDRAGADGVNRQTSAGTSSANSAQDVDISAGGAGTVLVIEWAHITFEGATIGADTEIQLLDGAGGTVLWRDIIGVGESEGTPHQTPPGFHVPLTANTLARLSIEAGGAGVITHGSLGGYLIPA